MLPQKTLRSDIITGSACLDLQLLAIPNDSHEASNPLGADKEVYEREFSVDLKAGSRRMRRECNMPVQTSAFAKTFRVLYLVHARLTGKTCCR